jgi:hypothetical protein
MDMTTSPATNALQPLQQDVQRLLGRCLLRLQQYERLMKAIVAHHEISGPAHSLEAIRAARIEDAATKTLGTLVGQLFGSYVVTDGNGGKERDNDLPGDVISFRTRVQLSLSAQDYANTQADLKDLVSLRNTLVHHFIDQHDLWTVDGCRVAQDELGSAYTRIDQHFEQLRGWAEHMDQARRLAAEFVQSEHRPRAARGRRAVGRRGLDTHCRRWPLDRGPASRAASSQVRLQQLAAGGARVPPVRASLP